ncbi:ribosomal RNA processing protein 1 homolog A-like isoform X2 [Melanotaenia boesemani]|uniref:ribosomal RNA processing protein 1 homolog A-like isoform X2 n=1 Tax=Melanotaenia boesemani TaxID=1250792 RepID=UPI001C044BC3|nr:ribosomal RNA processing protein 1 homolog A-like isoform X2 [Melanotaenia boesemani]
MASVQEPEVQLAQRLASNEKSVRTRAIKKLRKYIGVRSEAEAGGFTGDELLKLWKGLFYCLWMQDKPQLQEALSNQISTLIHSFHGVDGQLLYLESFLQTFKREWTGIDRLRMDKFFQLIRFMFRQTFVMLERKDWDSGAVSKFLELLSLHLLQSGAEAPIGLQLHVLDVYMTELAAVGSAQLTADQNLVFIEPFCRTAAKTKNQTLFRSICTSIFSTIIDQAPFAIKDLMEELEAAEDMDSDSGRASEEDDKLDGEKTSSRASNKKAGKKQINGKTSHKEEDDDEDDELLGLEDSDTEPLDDDDDVGPVLQFNYAALADKLFEFASRTRTPGQNRKRLYKIIKVLRDLSEGIFPQDDYPEEVSTDEEDDMFGSRKRMKRRQQTEDEEAPTGKKRKANSGKKEDLNIQNQTTKVSDVPANKNKEKKKAKENQENLDQGQTESAQDVGAGVLYQISTSVNEMEAANPTQPPVRTTEDKSKKKRRRKKKKKKGNISESEITQQKQQDIRCEGDAPVIEEVRGEAEVSAGSCEASTEVCPGAPMSSKEKVCRAKTAHDEGCSGDHYPAPGLEKASHDTVSVKDTSKKKKKKKAGEVQTADSDPAQREVVCSDAERTSGTLQTTGAKSEKTNQKDSSTPDQSRLMKRKRKKNLKDEAGAVETEITKATPTKKKTLTAAQVEETGDETPELPPLRSETAGSSGKAAKKKKKIPVEFEFEADELVAMIPTNGSTEETKPADRDGTARSELKKVTFGLKNNQTAEFRRTDRSMLLSPDGSSRVPFDPQQKPKFGVLKSTVLRKNPVHTKKTSSGRQNSSWKRRPLAADFF